MPISLTERLQSEAIRAAQWFLDLDRRGEASLRRQSFWPLFEEYRRQSKSAGCSTGDYWFLYRTILDLRPREVLECGTGASTLVIAAALAECEKAGFGHGRVTSMEDQAQWHRMSQDLFPDELRPYVEFVLSPRAEYTWSIFRGVGYQDVPDRPYSFMFVDGPGTRAPSDGMMTFDFDFINIVKRADTPVRGLVDGRHSTCYALQKILGADKVRYDPVRTLGILGPCTKNDLAPFRGSTSPAFAPRLGLLGRTTLDFRIERDR